MNMIYRLFLLGFCLLTGFVNANEKVFPEAHDPVLGDRAAIIEWAWSPAYAKRFGLTAQSDGLKNGPIWLLGIKLLRQQSGSTNFQTYTCRISGLIENKTSIIWPPGDRYIKHPGYHWLGGVPGKPKLGSQDLLIRGKGYSEQNSFSPAQVAWYKHPSTKRQQKYAKGLIDTSYLFFHRYHTADLAYFELHASCSYFYEPKEFRHEVRFPTRIDGKNDENPRVGAVYEPSALTVDIPDSLMKKVYLLIRTAADWNTCLMHRAGISKGMDIYVKKQFQRIGNPSCKDVKNKK